jgi:hypothetical protein
LTSKFLAIKSKVFHGLDGSTTAEADFRCSYPIEECIGTLFEFPKQFFIYATRRWRRTIFTFFKACLPFLVKDKKAACPGEPATLV